MSRTKLKALKALAPVKLDTARHCWAVYKSGTPTGAYFTNAPLAAEIALMQLSFGKVVGTIRHPVFGSFTMVEELEQIAAMATQTYSPYQGWSDHPRYQRWLTDQNYREEMRLTAFERMAG